MLMAMERPKNTATAAPSAEPTDDELMMAVAESRQVAAFEQLYCRHERAAYNLALHLTGNRAMAEEAVQDAALRIWRMAEKFRPDGSFKGWFFTTVVNCSKKHRQGRCRDHLRSEHLAFLPRPRERKETEDGVEDQELSQALHKEMERLEPLDRSLLALYFGAGLNQREIGRVLEVPQTTVSMKIREAVGRLRAGLTTAGFASAVPLLESGALGDAVLNGAQVPPGLHGWIMASLRQAARDSMRGGAAATGTWMGWLAAGLLVLVGVGAWSVMAPGRAPQTPRTASPESGGEDSPQRSAAEPPPRRILGAWDFNTPEKPEAFEFSYGQWTWSPDKGSGGSGCLWTPEEATIHLDLPVSRLPVRVSYRLALASFDLSMGGSACVIGWEAHQGLAHFRNIGKLFTIDTSRPPPWQTNVWYLSEEAIAGMIEGELVQLFLVEHRKNERLAIIFPKHYYVDDFEVREVTKDELPDLTTYRKAVADIPMPLRRGTVEVPHLKSPREGRKVFIEFHGPTHK